MVNGMHMLLIELYFGGGRAKTYAFSSKEEGSGALLRGPAMVRGYAEVAEVTEVSRAVNGASGVGKTGCFELIRSKL